MILWGVLHFCSSNFVSVLSWFGPMAITAMTRRPEDASLRYDRTMELHLRDFARTLRSIGFQGAWYVWKKRCKIIQTLDDWTGMSVKGYRGNQPAMLFFSVHANEKPPRSRTILNPFCTHVIWTYFTVQNIAYIPYVPYVQAYQTQIKRCSLNCILKYCGWKKSYTTPGWRPLKTNGSNGMFSTHQLVMSSTNSPCCKLPRWAPCSSVAGRARENQLHQMGVSRNGGYSKAGWFTMEIPLKYGWWLGVGKLQMSVLQ